MKCWVLIRWTYDQGDSVVAVYLDKWQAGEEEVRLEKTRLVNGRTFFASEGWRVDEAELVPPPAPVVESARITLPHPIGCEK